jgi:hypothetical protein
MLLPFNRDQVIMSQEENTCDLSKFQARLRLRAAAVPRVAR